MQVRQRLFALALPEQWKQHLILLFAPGAPGSALAGLDRAHRVLDFTPQMGPVQLATTPAAPSSAPLDSALAARGSAAC